MTFFAHPDECPDCAGAGWKCERCKGTGKITITWTCEACGMRGRPDDTNVCANCGAQRTGATP